MNQPIVAQKDTAMTRRIPDLQSPSYHFDQSNRERAAIGLPPQERIALAPDAEIERLRTTARQFRRLEFVGPQLVDVSPIPGRLLSRKDTDACQDAVDFAVEKYGYAAVARALALIRAANGGA